ncbi:hypothetical protein [Flavobacterium sp. '19STA2R22 D10 B1']|uniref:hypothetical protein n=1 Tax=Flavobacterium aerium TaxID=3037261 RepID=UPI00278C3927|nr:hypothetical protein [Flavobacterium sp. '19STA2R22 D10 B1']
MEFKSLLGQLQLAYGPMSNYDFSILKQDSIVQDLLRESSLYIIAQRPVLSFENLTFNEIEKVVYFEIHQKNNLKKLSVKLPFFQENIATDYEKEVIIDIGSNDPDHVFDRENIVNVHGIKFYESTQTRENFLVWFSPEKFIHNYSRGHIEAEITGNVGDFLNYKVLYVGKATDQDIWTRLTGHSSLQDILSVEYPFVYGSLPTHEIVLLLFEFYDNFTMRTYDINSSVEEMTDSFLGKNHPDKKTVFLDAEKALIKAMQPKHNKVLFKNYPKSKDGLHKHNFDTVGFTFMDPITLKYENGVIRGGLNFMGGDIISIKNNTDFSVITL